MKHALRAVPATVISAVFVLTGVGLYAELFHQGKGTPVNFDLAAHWYLEAASQGHPHAMVMLARMQARGQGPELDREELVRWLEEAAANGSVAAEQALYELPDP